MTNFKSIFTALFAVALTAMPAAANSTVRPLSPVGAWEMTSGESRFKVSLCGDGTELCAQLVWLRDDARSSANAPLLNKYVLMNAKLALTNK